MANLDIDQFYPTQFETTWKDVLQQKESRLLSRVMRDDFSGKNKLFNLVSDSEMTAVTTRKGDTPDGDFDGLKYNLIQAAYEKVTTFDEWDQMKLGQIVLPTSETMRQHVQAANRRIDKTIIAALGGTRYIGEDGATPDVLPSAQKIAVDYTEVGSPTNSGLTIAKLRAASSLLNAAEVPEEGRVFVYSHKELDNLLRTTEITSADYNTIRALQSGSVDTFMGFKFIRIEEKGGIPVGVIGSDITSCYAYHPEGVKFSMHGLKAYMDVLPTRRHALQVRTTCQLGAVRVQNEYVVEVACDRSPA